ncbi:MAG: hypothetical protein GW823_05790 [Bacteroidetes bacterium]|nr:hypothetical protein [Bacteroidota bacterium]
MDVSSAFSVLTERLLIENEKYLINSFSNRKFVSNTAINSKKKADEYIISLKIENYNVMDESR